MFIKEHAIPAGKTELRKPDGTKLEIDRPADTYWTLACDCGWEDDFVWTTTIGPANWIAKHKGDHKCR